ncbi:MAG: hypothetical protein GY805_12920, partial [Chloroflexi bacterium]|nr:hypothetical protein [Chloroflexota bacterium]
THVAELQTTLRKQMELSPQTASDNGDNIQDNAETPPDGTDSAAPPSPAPVPAQPQTPPQMGPVAATAAAEVETKANGEIVTGPPTPRPISNMNRAFPLSAIPIPDHLPTDDRYAWYLVEIRPQNSFMADISMGDWLLVDLQPGFSQDVQDTEQPLLVVMNEELAGTIRVRPLDTTKHFQRIYLVTLADSPHRTFSVDEDSGSVTFSAEMAEIGINRSEIVGVVVGFWRPMREVLSTE